MENFSGEKIPDPDLRDIWPSMRVGISLANFRVIAGTPFARESIVERPAAIFGVNDSLASINRITLMLQA